MTLDTLVGLAELAELFGMSKQTVSNWRSRQDFPEPVAQLRSGPIWQLAAVEKWAQANGLKLRGRPAEASDTQVAKPAKVVALINMKGGVGKSTLTANLGWYCAYRAERKVLMIDLDPQFNLSQYVLGNSAYEKHIADRKPTIVDLFERPGSGGTRPQNSADLKKTIAHVRDWDDGSRIDLVPSSLELAWTLKNPHQKEHLLRDFIDEIRANYDLILIDAAPTESVLTQAAYFAAEYLLIPVKPEFLAAIGLPLLARSLKDFEDRYKNEPIPRIAGVVFNDSADSAEHYRSRAYVKKLAKQQNWYVFKNEISHSNSYAAGARTGKPIFLTDYARSWKVSEFNSVADEFIERVAI